MKKNMIIAAVGVMLSATAAQAEHKLLVTDVLDAKQVEAQATYEYQRASAKISGPALGNGKITSYASEAALSLGVGLGHGLELSASVPYVFSEREKIKLEGEEPEYEKRDGFGDFAVEAKYRLLGGEHQHYTVVTGLGVKFDTAGEVGTGTTNVSPFVAASMELPNHHTPYAIYRATIRNHGDQDTHTVTLGLEKEFNHTFTLDAKIQSNFNTASSKFTANEDFLFELGSYIQVAHNFYLLPSVGYVVATGVTNKEEEVRLKSADGVRAGVALYYLF